MSGAVCPACGVAVVPGYVRCPKCHKALPRRAATVAEGGTAVEDRRRLPLIAGLAAALAGAILIGYLGLRATSSTKGTAPVATTEQVVPEPVAEAEAPAAEPAPTTAPAGPDPVAVAANLERALKRERLWSTVTVVGARADVRSGSCGDPAMGPVLEAALPALRAAGLTKLRCLEQSGRVVSDRDL